MQSAFSQFFIFRCFSPFARLFVCLTVCSVPYLQMGWLSITHSQWNGCCTEESKCDVNENHKRNNVEWQYWKGDQDRARAQAQARAYKTTNRTQCATEVTLKDSANVEMPSKMSNTNASHSTTIVWRWMRIVHAIETGWQSTLNEWIVGHAWLHDWVEIDVREQSWFRAIESIPRLIPIENRTEAESLAKKAQQKNGNSSKNARSNEHCLKGNSFPDFSILMKKKV